MPYYPQSPGFYPPANSVTNAMLSDMPDGTLKGRQTGAGAGAPQDLSTGFITYAMIGVAQVGWDRLIDKSIALAKLPDIQPKSFIGKWYANPAGAPEELSGVAALTTLGQVTIGSTGLNWLHRPLWQWSDGNGIGTTAGQVGGLEIQNSASGAAMIAFHRVGAFGAYLGIDTDNQFKVGGWSMGAAAYALFHAGNIPTKAVMESTAGSGAVTPSYTRNHPGVAKVYMAVDSGTGVYAGYGFSSVADSGAGITNLYYAVSIRESYYPVLATPHTTGFIPSTRVQGLAPNSVQIVVTNVISQGTQDPTLYYIVVFGSDAP